MKLPMKKVSFDCPVDIVERLDKLAETADLPRQKLIANMVTVGVETIEDCQKIGVLQISLLFRDLGESMKVWAKKMKDRKDFNGLI